jgi:hypothetical protein
LEQGLLLDNWEIVPGMLPAQIIRIVALMLTFA